MHSPLLSPAAALPANPTAQVGLDFGTYASGFAFSTDGGNSVREFTTYADQPAPYPKALTAILYQHGVPVHWGWTAQRVWMGLSPKERWAASVLAPGLPAE
jgi:hypothetical protein